MAAAWFIYICGQMQIDSGRLENCWMVGSEYNVIRMKAWIHPVLYQQFRWTVM